MNNKQTPLEEVKEKVRQTLEEIQQGLQEWFGGKQRQPVRIPVPADRRVRRRRH